MSTVAITPTQQRLLDRINTRLDRLDAAASPTVTSILTAAHRLPPADRLAIHRRLMSVGHPDTQWASTLHADR